jgi:hypothetical protein
MKDSKIALEKAVSDSEKALNSVRAPIFVFVS